LLVSDMYFCVGGGGGGGGGMIISFNSYFVEHCEINGRS